MLAGIVAKFKEKVHEQKPSDLRRVRSVDYWLRPGSQCSGCRTCKLGHGRAIYERTQGGHEKKTR